MTIRLVLIAGLAGLGAACASTEPECREASAAERAVFGALVAHDEARAAGLMAPTGEARRLRELDPQIEAQIFGARMGEASVRTVLSQPPLCVFDQSLSRSERLTYVFPAGRLAALQDPDQPGPELGRPGLDHAACRFIEQDGQWRLADACLATFAPSTPAS